MKAHRLRDLFQKTDSGVWAAENVDSGISILRSTNFTEDGELDLARVTLRAVEDGHRAAKALAPGDILLEKSGGGPKQPVGRVAIFRGDERPHVFGNFIARLRANSEICVPEFAFYLLRRMHEQGITTGYQKQTTGIRNLEMRRYLDREVKIPSIDEQRRIVDILDRAVSIRRLQRQARKTVRQIVPALFIKMFGDPGANPMGWPVTPFGDLLSACDYGTSEKASDEREGMPVIRMGNVTVDGRLDLRNLKFLPRVASDMSRYGLLRGDLLFNRTNSKELVGKMGLWDGNMPAVAASYFIRVRVDLQAILPEYVWAFFNMPFMKRRLFETARGAIGQANINSKELKSFQVPVPPLQLQKRFSDHLASLKHIEHQHARAILEEARASAAIQARVFNSWPPRASGRAGRLDSTGWSETSPLSSGGPE